MIGDKTLFVILGLPRSGSTHLGYLLESHPAITYSHECFNIFHVHRFSSLHGLRLSEWNAHNTRPLEAIKQRARTPVAGFKLFEDQRPLLFNHVLENRDIKKILIFRKNRIEQYVSWFHATKTGRWNAEPGKASLLTGLIRRLHLCKTLWHYLIRLKFRKCYKLVAAILKVLHYKIIIRLHPSYDKVTLQPKGFWRYEERIRKAQDAMLSKLQETGQDYCLVYYEDLVGSDSAAQVRRILDFLGVDNQVPLTSPQVKINPADLKDRIANYEQFRGAMRGTAYEF